MTMKSGGTTTTTVNPALPLIAVFDIEVAVIVVLPTFRPVARPLASIVATFRHCCPTWRPGFERGDAATRIVTSAR
jgi:hypothetical protein